MKKIYITPVSELLGDIKTEMFCASTEKMQGYVDDELEIGWEGEDKQGLEADANKHVWDHFDTGM